MTVLNRGSGKPGKRDPEPRILGALLATPTVLLALPSPRRMAEFVAQAMMGIPGVSSSRICLPGVSVSAGGFVEKECDACTLVRETPTERGSLPAGYFCSLAGGPGLHVAKLATYDGLYGFFALRLADAAAFAPYEPFLSNFGNFVALALENHLQRRLLEKANDQLRLDIVARQRTEQELKRHKEHLEELVAERTRALTKSNEALQREATQRSRAEAVLRESEAMLNRAQAVAHVGSWHLDVVRDELTWSDETYRMFGQPIGKPLDYARFLEFVHPEDRDYVDRAWTAALHGEPYDIEHRIVVGDQVKWVREKAELGFDAAGRAIRGLGTVQDISERKQAEEALRQSEKKYRTFFEQDLAGHYISTPDGRLLNCNRAFARIFGFTSVEEANAADIVSLYRHPEAREEFLRQLRERKQLENFEKEYRRRDGKPLYAIENAVGMFDRRGELVEIHGFLIDDTERRRAEQQLRQAQKMEAVGRLAGGVAHDFNNLLGVIIGYAELLSERVNPADPMHKPIKEIQKAAERSVTLTRQLLAFSRMQMFQQTLVDLNVVVKEMSKLLGRLIGEDIELVTALEPELGHVKADEGQIEQVILNLAVNARDAMPQGGTLSIETANVAIDESYAREHVPMKAGPHVMLSVSDTGTGMEQDIQAHLFEPFFTTKGQGRGTGLGLATVYGIVKQSGGYIWVYSEPGHGTTFKVYLPRCEESLEVSKRGQVPAQMPRGWETVLLVEDAAPLRELTREFLEGSGYTVLEAENAAEALHVVERHPGAIPLLITDVVMPGMSGRELAVRLAPLRPEMRVLYISGYTDEAVAHHGVLAPGVAFLQKPYTRDALARKVREVLDLVVSERLQ